MRLSLPGRESRSRGQIIVLFAGALTLIIAAVGLVVDAGNALAQRRMSQNASDFAAMSGARIVAEFVGGDTINGTDANVQQAITIALARNAVGSVAFGAPSGPRYINDAGNLLAFVGGGSIPGNAAGVTLSSSKSFQTYFLGLFGMGTWTASSEATAKGGFAAGGPPPGTLFPAGISLQFFQTYPFCAGPVSSDPSNSCYPQRLTPGNLNVPGGFGWLKFGCDGYGLGQDPPANEGGCREDTPFLQGQIGPPGKTYGCCTAVGLAGSLDRIGSLPGNVVSADCSYYIDNEIVVTVPIWDNAGGTGSNAYYEIIGFAGFQLTGCSGGKNIEGVWRKVFFTGPVTTTPGAPGVPQMLAVQLVR